MKKYFLQYDHNEWDTENRKIETNVSFYGYGSPPSEVVRPQVVYMRGLKRSDRAHRTILEWIMGVQWVGDHIRSQPALGKMGRFPNIEYLCLSRVGS